MATRKTKENTPTEVIDDTTEVIDDTTEVIDEELNKKKQTVNFVYPKGCTISRGKQAYLSSKKYIAYRDILNATLDEDKRYTESEVVEVVESYLNGGIE